MLSAVTASRCACCARSATSSSLGSKAEQGAPGSAETEGPAGFWAAGTAQPGNPAAALRLPPTPHLPGPTWAAAAAPAPACRRPRAPPRRAAARRWPRCWCPPQQCPGIWPRRRAAPRAAAPGTAAGGQGECRGDGVGGRHACGRALGWTGSEGRQTHSSTPALLPQLPTPQKSRRPAGQTCSKLCDSTARAAARRPSTTPSPAPEPPPPAGAASAASSSSCAANQGGRVGAGCGGGAARGGRW